MATKIKKSNRVVKDESYKTSAQYKYFQDTILGKYEFDKFYDTGEVFIIKEPNRKLYYGIKKKIKFVYNPLSMAGEIHEYYVDLKTGDNKILSYKDVGILDDMIVNEACYIISLQKALEKYIPLDNFTFHSANKFKETIENLKKTQSSKPSGINPLALRWDVKVVVNHKYMEKDKMLIDHIVSRTGFTDFFWNGIEMEELEKETKVDEKSMFLKPIWNSTTNSWTEGATKEEIEMAFAKYFN